MTELAFGIDLGTSTSEIAVFKDGESYVIPDPGEKTPIVPSLVAMNTKGRLKVGHEALSWVDKPGHGCREFKRLMGTGERLTILGNTYRAEELSAHVLSKLKENAAEAMSASIHEVVISVPANFPDPARAATRAAGELAGLNVLRLINEPTAAALAFGIKHLETDEKVVVFDFGGGTLDVTVLEMISGIVDVRCSYGDTRLGGKDFDQVVQDLILRKFREEHPTAQITETDIGGLKQFAEKAKKQLSSGKVFDDPLPSFGTVSNEPVDLEVELTRHEFEEAARPILDRARACLEEAIRRSTISRESVDRVLLVGGTTYVPAVRTLVAEFFGKDPLAEVEPDLAVSKGAAVQAALALGQVPQDKGVILTDVSPFGLGVDVLSIVGGQPMVVYDALMPPNTTIPYAVKRDYSLVHEEQEAVTIRVYQDHSGTAKLPQDATDIGIEARISDIPPSKSGEPHPLEVEFSYDINGLAKLTALIKETRQKVEVAFTGSELRMNAEEQDAARQRVSELWRHGTKARQYEGLLDRGQRLLDETSDPRRELLQGAMHDLKRALASDKEINIERAADRLIDLIQDIEYESI